MGPCIPSPYASMLTNFASIIILVCDMQAWVRHFLACVFALQMKKSKCGCRCKVRNLTLKIERGKISEEMNEFGWIHIRFACMSWISLEEQVINTICGWLWLVAKLWPVFETTPRSIHTWQSQYLQFFKVALQCLNNLLIFIELKAFCWKNLSLTLTLILRAKIDGP